MIIAEQKFDVFTLDELETIQKILNCVPTQEHTQVRAYTNGFTKKDFIYPAIKKLVIDRINQQLANPINSLTVGMQLIAQFPFGPHSDHSGKNDSGGGHAYLIPLYVKYQDSVVEKLPSYTIIYEQIFKQFFKTRSVMEAYIKTNPVLPKNNAESIWDQHMSQWPQEWAKYLSVHTMAEWKLGSVIYWNRDAMHSSDDFIAKHIQEKSALILFGQ